MVKLIIIIRLYWNDNLDAVILISLFRVNLGDLPNVRWVDESVVGCFSSLNEWVDYEVVSISKCWLGTESELPDLLVCAALGRFTVHRVNLRYLILCQAAPKITHLELRSHLSWQSNLDWSIGFAHFYMSVYRISRVFADNCEYLIRVQLVSQYIKYMGESWLLDSKWYRLEIVGLF